MKEMMMMITYSTDCYLKNSYICNFYYFSLIGYFHYKSFFKKVYLFAFLNKDYKIIFEKISLFRLKYVQ